MLTESQAMPNSASYESAKATFRAANAQLVEITRNVAGKLGIVDISSPAAIAEAADAADRAAILAAITATDAAARAARSARDSARQTT
jgi:hypothetical protein